MIGGVTTGSPIVCRVGFKPTSTINKPQQSVRKNLEEIEFQLKKGRHDPCVGVRAGVTLESRLAIELMNAVYKDVHQLALNGNTLEIVKRMSEDHLAGRHGWAKLVVNISHGFMAMLVALSITFHPLMTRDGAK